DRGLRITKGVPVVRGDHGALQTILLGVWQVAASSLTTGSACLRSGGSSTIFTSKNTSFGRRFAVARKNCTNDLLAAHYPTPSRRTWRGGLICSNTTRRKHDASSSLRATRPVSSVLLT